MYVFFRFTLDLILTHAHAHAISFEQDWHSINRRDTLHFYEFSFIDAERNTGTTEVKQSRKREREHRSNRLTFPWCMHVGTGRKKMKDKERKGENNRLMSGVERTERHCHWISDVDQLKARWISARRGWRYREMTLPLQNVETGVGGESVSRCTRSGRGSTEWRRRYRWMLISAAMRERYRARSIDTPDFADNFTRKFQRRSLEPWDSCGGSIRELHRASYRNCSLWETPFLRSQLSQCT